MSDRLHVRQARHLQSDPFRSPSILVGRGKSGTPRLYYRYMNHNNTTSESLCLSQSHLTPYNLHVHMPCYWPECLASLFFFVHFGRQLEASILYAVALWVARKVIYEWS